MTEYLTIGEAAEFLRVAPRTLRNKMANGIFQEGWHFFRPPGMGPRFKRRALEQWVEGTDRRAREMSPLDDIPMVRNGLPSVVEGR